MRVLAAVLLSMSIVAWPLFATDANEAGKEETTAAAVSSSTPAAAEKPEKPAKPEASASESELQDLRSLVEEQKAELDAQRAALKAEQLKMEALEEKLGGAKPAESATAPVAAPAAISAPAPAAISVTAPVATPAVMPGAAIESTPAIMSSSSAAASSSSSSSVAMSSAAMSSPAQDNAGASPLYIKLGTTELYPLGFADATNIFRTTNLTGQGGGTIGTSFNSIPFNDTLLGHMTEDKMSEQNSRIGFRTHSDIKGGTLTGYLEADFLGYLAPSGNVTSNSDSLRLRLFWADYRRGAFEILGGQSWSLLTPNRNGLSALPGDLFYGQEMDTNYLLGLTWTRQAGIRVILHPTNNWAIGASLENPQQTLPGTVVIPGTVPAALNPNANYGGQFDTNTGNTSSTIAVNNTSIPNLFPDLIVKTAFDADPGGHHIHFDLAGLLREYKVMNLVQSTFSGSVVTGPVYDTIHGGGVEAGLNIELVKNLRWITTAYYSSGGGRYIGNTGAPDVVIKADGTMSGIKTGSGISGFEYQVTPAWMFYGYYSGAYIGKDVVGVTSGSTTTLSGYGYAGSSNSADRFLYEPTFGIIETIWKNPNYGDLKAISQFSYVSRTPWAVAPGTEKTAHTGMVYLDLRYDLP